LKVGNFHAAYGIFIEKHHNNDGISNIEESFETTTAKIVILEQSGKDFTPHWVALQDTLTL
jgi:hypothetical protein